MYGSHLHRIADTPDSIELQKVWSIDSLFRKSKDSCFTGDVISETYAYYFFGDSNLTIGSYGYYNYYKVDIENSPDRYKPCNLDLKLNSINYNKMLNKSLITDI